MISVPSVMPVTPRSSASYDWIINYTLKETAEGREPVHACDRPELENDVEDGERAKRASNMHDIQIVCVMLRLVHKQPNKQEKATAKAQCNGPIDEIDESSSQNSTY